MNFGWSKGLTKETDERVRRGALGKIGKTHSEEHKRKMSLASKGKPKSERHKKNISKARFGIPPWNKGLRGYNAGAKHSNWKGGISSFQSRIRNSIEYSLWRKAIFYRDNYTCVWCGQRGGNLQADHIIPLSKIIEKIKFQSGIENLYDNVIKSEIFNDTNNGRTLCKPCHKKTDTYAGKCK